MLVGRHLRADHILMEWQIKTMAEGSAFSGKAFNPGDRVVCLVFKDTVADELMRIDILQDEVDDLDFPGALLGRWTRIVDEPGQEGKDVLAALQSAEDFFLSLYEVPDEQAAPPEKQALQHILGLMLERKRVLRPIGCRRTTGDQPYVHIKSKQTFDVPIVNISSDLMHRIEPALGDLIV